jgi:hypothetical protein
MLRGTSDMGRTPPSWCGAAWEEKDTWWQSHKNPLARSLGVIIADAPYKRIFRSSGALRSLAAKVTSRSSPRPLASSTWLMISLLVTGSARDIERYTARIGAASARARMRAWAAMLPGVFKPIRHIGVGRGLDDSHDRHDRDVHPAFTEACTPS